MADMTAKAHAALTQVGLLTTQYVMCRTITHRASNSFPPIQCALIVFGTYFKRFVLNALYNVFHERKALPHPSNTLASKPHTELKSFRNATIRRSERLFPKGISGLAGTGLSVP